MTEKKDLTEELSQIDLCEDAILHLILYRRIDVAIIMVRDCNVKYFI